MSKDDPTHQRNGLSFFSRRLAGACSLQDTDEVSSCPVDRYLVLPLRHVPREQRVCRWHTRKIRSREVKTGWPAQQRSRAAAGGARAPLQRASRGRHLPFDDESILQGVGTRHCMIDKRSARYVTRPEGG